MVQVGLSQERQDLRVSELAGSHKQKFRGSPLGLSFHQAEIIEQLNHCGHLQPQASELRPTQSAGGDLDFKGVFQVHTDLSPVAFDIPDSALEVTSSLHYSIISRPGPNKALVLQGLSLPDGLRTNLLGLLGSTGPVTG